MTTAVSTLEMALLGLLTGKPQSGYELRKTFATTAMRHYSDSPGSIYPALRRLESRGWIEVRGGKDEPADPRRRQDFQLTREGKERLAAWLEAPLTREDVRMRQNEIMLRFAFMDGNVARSTIVRFLDQLIAEFSEYIAELRAQWEQMAALIMRATGGEPLHTGLLAFESGIEGMEAQVAWARRTRARFGEGSK